MNIWNNTTRPVSIFLRFRKMFLELVDMFFSGFILGAARAVHELDTVSALGFYFMKASMDGHKTVHPATSGFARRLFYHHDEIEYGVPFERYQECLREVRQYLLDKNYFAIIEVRFAPNRSAGLLSPGACRRTAYIELAPSLSSDVSEIFIAAEKIFWKYDGHVHLGKWTKATSADMQRMYGQRYERFERVRLQQDPDGKFMNEFTDRLFKTPGPSTHTSSLSVLTSQ